MLDNFDFDVLNLSGPNGPGGSWQDFLFGFGFWILLLVLAILATERYLLNSLPKCDRCHEATSLTITDGILTYCPECYKNSKLKSLSRSPRTPK